jgi:hypothetical protein
MNTIYKSISGGVKDFDMQKRVVTGYLSNFGNKDLHGDVIEKGAFKKSISERKDSIFFLNQHDWKQPHGKFNVLIEDEKGLYFESTPLLDTSYSSDLLKLYDAGIINEHSIGFSTIKANYDKKSDTNYMTELKLYEGSNVTLGANPNTPFTGMKALTLKEVNEQSKKILKAFRDGTFTDDTFGLLEVALKQLQDQAFELGKQSLNDQEPSLDTPIKSVEPMQIEILNNFIKGI